eukprot:GDKI01040410.1.p2 GENE.GDKI01040410.1~~GDKI01040410.1.p2  ORF type:complete len:241 (+),score=72.66 GDKI01040410.1:420-1142(+)
MRAQVYLKPTTWWFDTRNELGYFPKYNFIKYAASVVKYSTKHHLMYGAPLRGEDEMRFVAVKPTGIPSLQEHKQGLLELSKRVEGVMQSIREMDGDVKRQKSLEEMRKDVLNPFEAQTEMKKIAARRMDAKQFLEEQALRAIALSKGKDRQKLTQTLVAHGWQTDDAELLVERLNTLVALRVERARAQKMYEQQSEKEGVIVENGTPKTDTSARARTDSLGMSREKLSSLFDAHRQSAGF